MANLFDTLFTVIAGTITTVSRAVTGTLTGLQDFFYVKFSGMAFIVLGARQTGKTTLIEWLRRNLTALDGFQPEPTAAGGDLVPDFFAQVGDTAMKLKPSRDVGGEYAMWETDWLDLFREAQPRGILFLLDHTDVHLQKDALNFVLQMIEDEPAAARQLKAFYILVNKYDLWGGETTLEELLHHYRNEMRRLKKQAERLGYRWYVSDGSLVTGRGVPDFIRKFFNAIRPKPQQA